MSKAPREALAELVACKDLKERYEAAKFDGAIPTQTMQGWRADYERRKPLAWEAARAALAEQEAGSITAEPVAVPSEGRLAEIIRDAGTEWERFGPDEQAASRQRFVARKVLAALYAGTPPTKGLEDVGLSVPGPQTKEEK